MKKLLLIRHAKAANPNNTSDFERPLTHSGMQDATIMAQRLHANGHIPQLLVASPALRTKTTANIFSEHLLLSEVGTNRQIYEGSDSALLHIINDFPVKHDFIALVGHNPGISEVLFYLTGKAVNMATCAMALIDFDIDDWAAVSRDTGNLVYYDEP